MSEYSIESSPPQVDYTSRDYESLRQDLLARMAVSIPEWDSTDPSDFGVAILEQFAYLGDLLSYYIDRAANESSLSTATRRDSVVALAADLGYTPNGYISSTATISFTNAGADDIVVPANTIVSATVTTTDASVVVQFSTDAAVTVSAESVASVTATQGIMVDGDFGFGEYLGDSDGTANQTFTLSTDQAPLDTIEVFTYDLVNYVPWSKVNQFADYGPTAQIFRPVMGTAGTLRIEFGDGVTGAIPAVGQPIYAYYRYTDGSLGNVPAGSIKQIDSIPGLDTAETAAITGELTVTNDSAASGGVDAESTESIRTNASLAYRALDRAVTLEDYQNLSLVVPGCGKASASSSTPSSVVVAVAPYRTVGAAEVRPGYDLVDGSWEESVEGAALRAAVSEYLDARRLAATQVSVAPPQYVTVYLGIEVEIEDHVRESDANVLIMETLLERLDYANVGFGASIYPSDLVALIASLGIARDVSVTAMNMVSLSSTAVGTVTAEFDELLTVTESNISLTITGGVS